MSKTPQDVTDDELAIAVTECDKAMTEHRRAKAAAKDARECLETANEILHGLARKRFCPDAAPLFDETDDDGE